MNLCERCAGHELDWNGGCNGVGSNPLTYTGLDVTVAVPTTDSVSPATDIESKMYYNETSYQWLVVSMPEKETLHRRCPFTGGTC